MFLAFLLLACSKNDDDANYVKSALSRVESFSLLVINNPTLAYDIYATVNHTEKTIVASVPFGTSLNGLTPTVAISDKAIMASPQQGTLNFSEAIIYTITAEDGTQSLYTATLSILANDEAKILSFQALPEEPQVIYNDALYYTADAIIDEAAKTILLYLPEGCTNYSITTKITHSELATVVASTPNLSDETIYTVTSESGKQVDYTVKIEWVANERDILINFYNANTENTLGWNVNSFDVGSWEGVSLNENRVTNLVLIDKNIAQITPGIGRLAQLTELNIQNLSSPAKITALPSELGNLSNLFSLVLNNNRIRVLPNEIGNLINLERLILSNNRVNALPTQIENLKNLKWLLLNSNRLNSIPQEIGNLPLLTELFLNNNLLMQLPENIGNLQNLKTLRLNTNNLTSLPNSIENMASLLQIDASGNNLTNFPLGILNLENIITVTLDGNNIVTIPEALGDVATLERLSVSNNELSDVPTDLSDLSNLKYLNIRRNNIRNISQEICDMETLYGTEIIKDNRVRCN